MASASTATIDFMRANGLDRLVDFYAIHFYPWNNAPTSRKANLEDNAVARCEAGGAAGKPCWITEWGVKNTDAACPVKDAQRPPIVAETMSNYRTLARQGRLAAAIYYTWNSNPGSNILDPMSVFRCGGPHQSRQARSRSLT